MVSLQTIVEPIQTQLEAVKRQVNDELQAVNEFAPEVGSYLQKMQGKYFRPTLVLLTAQMTGQDQNASQVLAQAVELLHLATLIHDDVLDDADLRRSQVTLHQKWGNRVAILVGDYLYSKTTQLLLQFKNFSVLDQIANVTVGFTQGELLQLFSKKQVQADRSTYLKVIELKTANFMGVCACFGGILMKMNWESLREFGYYLGMAFQISDDLLDVVGNPGEPAKPVHHDIEEGIISLPLRLSLEKATAQEKNELQMLLDDKDKSVQRFSQELISKYQGIDLAQKNLEDYIQKAKEKLKDFEKNQSLWQLLDFMVNRIPLAHQKI